MRPRLFFYEDRAELPHQFSVDDTSPRFTGILDARGEPIYEHKQPIGYVTEFPTSKPRLRIKARSSSTQL